MATGEFDVTVVRALLDTLLPGDGATWPSAGSLGLEATFTAEAGREAGTPLAALLARLPPAFATLPGPDRESALRQVDPALVTPIVRAAYRAYYTAPAIADLMRRLSRSAA